MCPLIANDDSHCHQDNYAETKYRTLFASMDLTRDFYFSYTYDLTNTLQVNLCSRAPPANADPVAAAESAGAGATGNGEGGGGGGAGGTPADSGVTAARDGGGSEEGACCASANAAAAAPAAASAEGAPPPPLPRDKFIWNHHLAYGLMRQLHTECWVPPLVHGFFMQLGASLFGRALTLTLIGR